MAITISGTTGIAGVDGSAGTPAVQGTDTNTGVFYPAADTVGVSTGGSERMRINSTGNVGIGLTSYSLPLSVVADANGQNIQINGRTGDDFGQIFFRNFGGANNIARIASDNSAGLIFGTGSQTAPTVPSERMRIDSSGNVGIGTSSPSTRLHVYNSAATSTTFKANTLLTVASNASGADATINLTDSVANNAVISQIGGALLFGTGSGAPETMRIDGSGNLRFNSGYGSVATAYGCRAWVNFNGTGTVAIRASGNVSSITDNGTGNYTVNFTTAMPDANYSVTGSGQYDVAGSTDGNSPQFGIARENPQPSVSAVRTRWVDRGSGISLIDPTICCIAIFR